MYEMQVVNFSSDVEVFFKIIIISFLLVLFIIFIISFLFGRFLMACAVRPTVAISPGGEARTAC